jgi:pSer/pThr/pTyr-binding forkhead associated (FHA) protein
MRCGRCGWDNPAGIIFCTNCGTRAADGAAAPLRGAAPVGAHEQREEEAAAWAQGPSRALQRLTTPPQAPNCVRCGAPGALGLRFCRECGTPLVPPAGAEPARAVDAQEQHFAAPEALPYAEARGAPAAAELGYGVPEPRSGAGPRSAEPGPAAGPDARLVMLLRDGSEGRIIPLGEGDTDLGAQEGDIVFADDPYLSPRHARVTCRAGTYTLRDLGSTNGIYLRLRDVQELRDRDMVLIGQQVLRFELLLDGELSLGPAWQGGVLVFGTPEVSRFARLVQYTTEGVGRDVHYLFRDETVIGRENGDIVFTDDPFLSRRHAAIRVEHAGRRFTLYDLGSSNGTALRIRGEHVLKSGDQFRMGRHLFRFEAGSSGGRSDR